MLLSEPNVVGEKNNFFGRVPPDPPERVSADGQTFPRSRWLVYDQSIAVVQLLVNVTDVSHERTFDQFCARVSCVEDLDKKTKEGVAKYF
jgi:hypothetical protein